MLKPDDLPLAPDRPRLAALAAEAERASRSGSGGPETCLPRALPPGEGRIFGKPGERVCGDCQAVIAKTLGGVEGDTMRFWEWPLHRCPEMEARIAQDRRERDAAYARWLDAPPSWRITDVRREVRLPHWTPSGLGAVREAEVQVSALKACRAHLTQWQCARRFEDREEEGVFPEFPVLGPVRIPVRGLWLWGPTNARKTTLTAALAFDIAHRFSREGNCALMWNAENLMEHKARAAHDQGNDYDPQKIENVPALFLDDIGTVRVTEAYWRTLYGIVEQANSQWGQSAPCQLLYVTSNESPDQLARRLALPGDSESGKRIVRRLVQLCEVVEVKPCR